LCFSPPIQHAHKLGMRILFGFVFPSLVKNRDRLKMGRCEGEIEVRWKLITDRVNLIRSDQTDQNSHVSTSPKITLAGLYKTRKLKSHTNTAFLHGDLMHQ
jgi:hypothetical protein